MIFTNRETEFPGKRKIIKVNENNQPIQGEAPILVNIHKDEGAVYVNGTPINAENLNKGNWRDDKSLSFKILGNNDSIPIPKVDETQIITKANGETWIVPPSGLGEAKNILNGGSASSAHAPSHGTGGSDPLSLGTHQIIGLDTTLAQKLDKVSDVQGNSHTRIYAVAPNGNQHMVTGTADPISNAIAFRTGDGNITIPIPQADHPNYAVNKDYVDTKFNTRVINGGARRTGGNVVLNAADVDKGKTIVFTSNVTGLTIHGSSVLENDSSYDDIETRYVFTTGASAITPARTNIDYQFPSSFSPAANKKYMVAIFGRVLTWSEGV